MENLNRYKKAILFQMLITALAVAAVLIIFGQTGSAKGFVLGSLFSLINFHIMARTMTRRLGKSRNKASLEGGAGMLLRMAVLAIPIFLAFKYPAKYNLIWSIIGIFNLQISILLYGLVIERFFVVGSTGTQGR